MKIGAFAKKFDLNISNESHFHQNVIGEQVEVHGYLAKKPVTRKKG